MKRLTYRGKTPNIAYCDYDVREIINKLAAYEDAEEQGLLIMLKVKPGDMVYCWRSVVPTKYTSYGCEKWLQTENKIIPARVVNVKMTKDGSFMKVALKGECFVKKAWGSEFITSEDYEYCTYNLRMSAIGKTVFLTKEEAEQALEEKF